MSEALRCLFETFPAAELVTDDLAFVPRPGHRWIERVMLRPNA